jgi:trehalose-phosphatase
MATRTTPELLVRMLVTQAGQGPVGLLLDYDGTVADITARPDLAGIPESTRARLEQLAASPRVRLAIVTGRSRAGLEAVAGQLRHITLAVNGGMQIFSGEEAWTHPEAARAQPLVAGAVRRLSEVVARWPGTIVEDKQLSLTVHYRQNIAARSALERAAEELLRESGGALRTLPGKESFEIQPSIEWDKGRATEVLLDRWETGAASLFLGDDRIDEPAFTALRVRGGLACRVGAHTDATEAEWTLASPEEVRQTLDLLGEAFA